MVNLCTLIWSVTEFLYISFERTWSYTTDILYCPRKETPPNWKESEIWLSNLSALVAALGFPLSPIYILPMLLLKTRLTASEEVGVKCFTQGHFDLTQTLTFKSLVSQCAVMPVSDLSIFRYCFSFSSRFWLSFPCLTRMRLTAIGTWLTGVCWDLLSREYLANNQITCGWKYGVLMSTCITFKRC